MVSLINNTTTQREDWDEYSGSEARSEGVTGPAACHYLKVLTHLGNITDIPFGDVSFERLIPWNPAFHRDLTVVHSFYPV